MHKFPLHGLLRSATAGYLRGFLLLFLIAGALAGAAAGSDAPPQASSISVGPGLQYAVADFDGDHRPDTVGVEPGASDVSRTKYWIQFQLSTAGRRSISIVAPIGGLQITARDVNGDQIPDLVLTTTWLRQPVAIFINDGHGTFTRAEPAAFPGAFRESQTSWVSPTDRAEASVGVPPSPRAGTCTATERLPHAGSRTGAVGPSNPGFPVSVFLTSQPGRAPPSEIPHL
jgi:hypothetical protein